MFGISEIVAAVKIKQLEKKSQYEALKKLHPIFEKITFDEFLALSDRQILELIKKPVLPGF